MAVTMRSASPSSPYGCFGVTVALIMILVLIIPSCLMPLLLENEDNTNTNTNTNANNYCLFHIFTQVVNPFSSLIGWNNDNDNDDNNNSDGYYESAAPPSRALSPDVGKCGPVGLPPNAMTSSNCCPPLPSPLKFTDFTTSATTNGIVRVRRAAHAVDEDYIAKFERGIALMKALPPDDPRSFVQQAKVHCAYCNGGYPQRHPFAHLKIDIHRSWLFFPFHRWYIYFFERILGHLIGDPSFALPYWNWDSQRGMHIPSYFANPTSPLYHKLRHLNHTPPRVVDLNYDGEEHAYAYAYVTEEQQVSYNLGIMYKQMVLARSREVFMGAPYRAGDEAQPGAGTLELAPHNTVHTWTGAADTPNHEDMGTFYTAARDPLFYPHHSNLDRLWHLWTHVLDAGTRRGYEDDPDWLHSHFFFYDENADLVRVNIRDCLDTAKLGYVYEQVELPWLTAAPPKPRRTRVQREAAKKNKAAQQLLLVDSEPTINKFPLVLDSKVSAVVKRPNRKEKEEEEEEVLVIEIVDLQSDKNVKFDVHIDDDDDDDELSGPDHTEFVGTFVSVPHGDGSKMTSVYKIAISKVLEDLEAQQDDFVVLTLVPKLGKGMLSIKAINIHFLPK